MTPYVKGDTANLIVRLREARDEARVRLSQTQEWIAYQRFGAPSETDADWTVAAQVEVLCSRLSEAADALERGPAQAEGAKDG
jgi:hypothetical protein